MLSIKCLVCTQYKTVKVENDDLIKYEKGAFAQDAFPYLSAADRELIISQTCGPCFDEMFGDEDEE